MENRRPLAIHWSVSSVNHLEQATGYIEADNVRAADTVRRRILKSVRQLADMPFIGHVGRIDGTRELVIYKTPYIVVYQVSSSAIEILGIWHTAREWPKSLESWNL